MGDGDLIVLLDLAEDDSRAEEGLAREFINPLATVFVLEADSYR